MKLHRNAIDYTGVRVGSLTILRPTGGKRQNFVEWEAECDCGNTTTGRPDAWKSQSKRFPSGNYPSCGCLHRANVTKHGMCEEPLYTVWLGMVQRCHNPNHSGYYLYGAKGVTVCPEWRVDPTGFIQWAKENGWETGLQLDKDILCLEKGIYPPVYSPDTCQFLTPKDNNPFSDLIKSKRG